jgi:methyl-accepting chemotaxis protein
MAEISAASVEQSSGIEQVNTAIAQMDDVTQQNAALVEEAAAAAESLEEQAVQLVQVVASFKLETAAKTLKASEKKPHKVQALPLRGDERKSRPAKLRGAEPRGIAAPAAEALDDDWKEF